MTSASAPVSGSAVRVTFVALGLPEPALASGGGGASRLDSESVPSEPVSPAPEFGDAGVCGSGVSGGKEPDGPAPWVRAGGPASGWSPAL